MIPKQVLLKGVVTLWYCVFFAMQNIGGELAATKSEKSLDFIRVDLPDGHRWVLGEGGIGRPFMIRLLLINKGLERLQILDPQSSEGSQCPGVILTDAQGRQTILRPAPIERSGLPTVLAINPDQVVKIDLELLRLVGERSLPVGAYKIRGFYENSLTNAFPIANVWTGRIESTHQQLQIVAPGGQ